MLILCRLSHCTACSRCSLPAGAFAFWRHLRFVGSNYSRLTNLPLFGKAERHDAIARLDVYAEHCGGDQSSGGCCAAPSTTANPSSSGRQKTAAPAQRRFVPVRGYACPKPHVCLHACREASARRHHLRSDVET